MGTNCVDLKLVATNNVIYAIDEALSSIKRARSEEDYEEVEQQLKRLRSALWS